MSDDEKKPVFPPKTSLTEKLTVHLGQACADALMAEIESLRSRLEALERKKP